MPHHSPGFASLSGFRSSESREGLAEPRSKSRISLHSIRATACHAADLIVEGELMSYGPDMVDLARRVPSYIDGILRGAKPQTCRSSFRQSTNWLSILRPRKRSASRSRKLSRSAPTGSSSNTRGKRVKALTLTAQRSTERSSGSLAAVSVKSFVRSNSLDWTAN